jgi:hypothetical protein
VANYKSIKDSLRDKGKLVAKMIVRNQPLEVFLEEKLDLGMSFKILPSR